MSFEAGETTDVTRKSQFEIVLRYVKGTSKVDDL